MTSSREPDEVLIVGGGPVGLATAVAVASRGLQVRVLDLRHPPIDKACGEGLMPDGVRWLHAHGVQTATARCASIRGIRYLDGPHVAEAEFDSAHGLGMRRPELHALLVKRAAELGVTIDWGVRALGWKDGCLETSVGELRPKWLVGADGLESRLRRWAGLEGRDARNGGGAKRTGLRRHYSVQPWTDHVEVYWADGCEAYVTPVGSDEVGVAVLMSEAPEPFDRALQRFPRLLERLEDCESSSTDRGAGPLFRRARAVQSGQLALVGDAAGYLDAITGEGLSLGFHEAEALAEAIEAGDLRHYERAFAKLVALPFRLIRLLLFAERHPKLRVRAIRALEREPELFARLLAIHTRDLPPSSLGLGGAVRFARRLVLA